jgi:putative mRNA 3-end processing factor
MNDESLLTLTENGLWCRQGNFYIDPWKPVNHAVVTHAHADHYAYGCNSYLIAQPGEKIFRKRLGADASIRTLAYGERLTVNSVTISLHPAGHILGAAQVEVEHNGYVEVVSGDYKLEADPTCAPFELQSFYY